MRLPNMARGVAGFIAAFTLVNLLGSLRFQNFDATHWWISADALPSMVWTPCLLISSLLLIAFACKPPQRGTSRWRATILFTTVLMVVTVTNGITFYTLLVDGRIAAGVAFPLSFLFSAALALVLWNLSSIAEERPSRRGWIKVIATAGLCTLVFPLTQIICFGKTDYRRTADAAVVFGARAYADGRPSDALADRVRTACELHRNGTVSKLIFSGGPGDGAIHETEAMRLMAISLGVNESDIILDPHGLSTQATVQNTTPLFEHFRFRRVLAVSHYFHLPRIKMTYQRAGVEVYTTPARESYMLRQTPFLLFRETAAWWVYYWRPLTSSAA
jgi:vancomycin permeability regulator SanA